MSKSESDDDPERDESAQTDHLDDVSDGCGCVEVWEGLSEYRQQTD